MYKIDHFALRGSRQKNRKSYRQKRFLRWKSPIQWLASDEVSYVIGSVPVLAGHFTA
jgi:hypothetical protein